jgi:hypothetical protein
MIVPGYKLWKQQLKFADLTSNHIRTTTKRPYLKMFNIMGNEQKPDIIKLIFYSI